MRIGKALQVVMLCVASGNVLAQEENMPVSAAEPAQQAAPAEPAAPPPADSAPEPVPPETGTVPVTELRPQAPPPAHSDRAAVLDTVVVTAQKRSEPLQKTPISIEALNADKIEQRGIAGLADLGAQVPNLNIQPFPTHNATLRLFIRGVGVFDAQVTQDPAVGVYVDGVYVARSVGLALDMADLERIEVLRGPQGTLYGRNTTGGAINFITRRPSPGAFSMNSTMTMAARNTWVGKGSFNVPLADNLAVKLAVLGTTRDGYVHNDGPGGSFGDRTEKAVRFDARWLPADWLSVDYAYDHSDMRYFNSMFQAVLPPHTNKGQAEYFKPFAVANTVFSESRLQALSSGPPMAPSGSRIGGHSLILTAPLGDYELKYVGAYRKLSDDEYSDLGGGKGSLDYRLDTQAYSGPAATVANGGTAGIDDRPTPLVVPNVFQSQWSHELQFSGSALDDTLEFIAGAFHFSEQGGENGRPLHHILSTVIEPQQGADALSSIPGLADAIAGVADPRLVVFWNYLYQIDNTASALFGQTTWSPAFFDRRLHLTFGFRRSWDSREAVKDRIGDTYVEGRKNGQGTAQLLSSEEKFDNVHASRSFRDSSPSFNLRYDLTPDATLYFTSAQAYKSGGFNLRDPQVSAASGAASDGTNYGFGFVEGFAPERVQSYEVGFKSEWLGRRLRVNTAVFDSEYKDLQINFLIPGTISDTKTRNAGKARMQGLELETRGALLPGLELSADYAYLDAQVLEALDIKGNNVASRYPFPSAPRHSFTTAIDWTLLDTGRGKLRGYLGYNYIDRRQGTVITDDRRGLTAIPAYGLINARLGLSGLRFGEGGALDFALWGKNLADQQYPLSAIDNLPQADRAVIWGEPRTLGMDLTYRYF